jgi:DNA-binding LacI/PurR family transcriptional regulator
MKSKSDKSTRSVTMRDVARRAGVSQPTVSRVLNGNQTAPISDETRERVLNAVEELNYYPNLLARSLRTQKTQMIALLIADISNSFYHPIARTVQDVAREHNFDVLLATSDHLYENELHFLEALRMISSAFVLIPTSRSRFWGSTSNNPGSTWSMPMTNARCKKPRTG